MRIALFIPSIIALFLLVQNSSAHSPNDFDLPLYNGWAKETIPIPLSFAPGIELSGLEELRFPPGMFIEHEQQYWSYLFVWWVEEEKVISESVLEKYLEEYFFGLAREIALFKKTGPSGASYTVALDSIGENSLIGTSLLIEEILRPEIPSLNIKVNQVICEPQKRLAVILELSPKAFEHSNWQTLSKLKTEFKCGA